MLNVKIPGLDKLVEFVLSDLLGPGLASWKNRKIAEGEVEGNLIRAKGQLIVRDLFKNHDLVSHGDMDVGGELTYKNVLEQKQLNNRASVVEQAAGFLKEKDVPDVEPDHDWAARFFNHIKDISSKEMQILWAKVLAGEVERQGTTSLLALDTLRNIDQTTARLFRRFCSASVYLTDGVTIYDARVPSLGGNVSQNSLEQYGLDYLTLVRLNEHGLVVPEFNSWRNIPVVLLQTMGIWFQGNTWRLTPRNSIETVKLNGVAMASSGRVLSRIVEIEPMPNFAEALQTFFSKQEIEAVEIIEVRSDNESG